MNSSFSPFISFHMDDFSFVDFLYSFLDLFFAVVVVVGFFFFYAGTMLIAAFITEMVILHKYVFFYYIIIIYLPGLKYSNTFIPLRICHT